MTIPTGTVLRCVASMLWSDGGINQNVFNCLVSGGSGPWDDTDIIDDVEAWFDNMYANLTSRTADNLDGNETIVYKWDTVGLDWDEVGSQTFTWNPVAADSYQARGVAGLVRLWTTDPDVQGKKYLPGATEAQMSDGLYIAAYLTALLAFGADWYLPFTGGVSGATFTPGVWSVVGSVFQAGVDHIAASSIPAYQRRRKRNVGI